MKYGGFALYPEVNNMQSEVNNIHFGRNKKRHFSLSAGSILKAKYENLGKALQYVEKQCIANNDNFLSGRGKNYKAHNLNYEPHNLN